MRLSIFLLAFSALGSSASVYAEGCAETLTKCALQYKKTKITDAVLNLSNCDTSSLEESLELKDYPLIPIRQNEDIGPKNKKFDPEKAPHAPPFFLRGVCRLHKNLSKLEEQQKAADYFQKAVTAGLMPSQKAAAALFEGLTHCRAVAGLKASVDSFSLDNPDLKKQNQNRDLFCLHRSMAKEAFSEVYWIDFSLEYTTSSKNLDQHINEMASCGRDLLQSSYDSVCGEITAVDAEDVKSLAVEAADTIIPHYVSVPKAGDSEEQQARTEGVPPFTAMMARKLAMTRASLAQSKKNFADLREKNQVLDGAYQEVLGAYGSMSAGDIPVPGPGTLATHVSQLQTRYIDAVTKARSLLELTQRWVDGLYTDDKKSDLRTFLSDRQQQLQEQMNFLENPTTGGLIKNLKDITDAITKMAGDAGTQNTAYTRSMCAMYFCELKARNRTIFKNACEMAVSPTQSVYDLTPLCDHPLRPELKGKLPIDGKTTVDLAEFCTGSGFNPVYLSADLAGHDKVNECMTTQFNATYFGVKYENTLR